MRYVRPGTAAVTDITELLESPRRTGSDRHTPPSRGGSGPYRHASFHCSPRAASARAKAAEASARDVGQRAERAEREREEAIARADTAERERERALEQAGPSELARQRRPSNTPSVRERTPSAPRRRRRRARRRPRRRRATLGSALSGLSASVRRRSLARTRRSASANERLSRPARASWLARRPSNRPQPPRSAPNKRRVVPRRPRPC
jgi:hypothetical protein